MDVLTLQQEYCLFRMIGKQIALTRAPCWREIMIALYKSKQERNSWES